MKNFKRLLGVFLVFTMVFTIIPSGAVKVTAAGERSNSADYTRDDIIAFGSYPQTKVTNASLIASLNAQTLQADQTVTYKDTKYKRVFFTTAINAEQATNGYNINTAYWFKFEPLQWRVLSSANGELFVMADKILDTKVYNQVPTGVTWETSNIRFWLNNDFYNTAFSSTEKLQINISALDDTDNPWTGTNGGNATADKLFLLSYLDVMQTLYGFDSKYYTSDIKRQAQGTDFSKSGGLYVSANSSSLENSEWWLRTPGEIDHFGYVQEYGNSEEFGLSADITNVGVRPAFRLNLPSYATGDIITLGSYPQTKVTSASLITVLNAQTLQADQTVTFNAAKYKRVFFTTAISSEQATNGYNTGTVYWFKFEPLQWQVLSNANGELFVMADKILDTRAYNQEQTDVTWETCTMRSWLNNDFYNTAFSSAEKSKINTSTLDNSDNPSSGTLGGNSTPDKLFLLSYADTVNDLHGFSSSKETRDVARQAQGTDFAKSSGLYVVPVSSYLGNSSWWLRTPGSGQQSACFVYEDGSAIYNLNVNALPVGVRPACKIYQPSYASGDIMTFGSYPQTKVTNESLIASLNAQTLQADQTVKYDGAKYKRVFFTTPINSEQDLNGYYTATVYWFKFEPLRWRVLSNTNGELFVMAEKILDSKAYSQAQTDLTWETCAMRSWLNNDFYNTAFSSTEKLRINTSTLDNADNPLYGTNGGNSTNDKLFLLSYADTVNTSYGFSSSGDTFDTARWAQGTDFSKSSGLWVSANSSYLENSRWWLRSPGDSSRAGFINYNGYVNNYGEGVDLSSVGVRPAFRLRLPSYVTGDIITLGSYPQTKVTSASLITALNAQALQADKTVTYDGAKYKRVFFTTATNSSQGINGYNTNNVYWFKFEPLQWRVLSYTNGELFVVADKILDTQVYDTRTSGTTWAICSMRSWLNNEFYNTAFSPTEKSQINTSALDNADNPWFGTNGGNSTLDKLFLLSYADSLNTSYGFSSSYDTFDTARRVQGTDFSKSNGLSVATSSTYLGDVAWWLRSPGDRSTNACLIGYTGGIIQSGVTVRSNNIGVRPAFKLHLPSLVFTSKSGSNSVIDYENKFIYGLDTGVSSLQDYVNVAPEYEVSYAFPNGGFGTGTVVNGLLDGKVVERYTLVIFGDVNGDGNIDSIDAGIMMDCENHKNGWDPAIDAAFMKAADLYGDGNIDSIDAGIAVDVENYYMSIDQTTGWANVF